MKMILKTKKCTVVCICILILFSAALCAQEVIVDPILLSYKRNFIRANLTTKLDLLTEASKNTTADMSPLFEDALQFVIQTKDILGDSDAQLSAMTLLSVEALKKYNSASSVDLLWQIFSIYSGAKIKNAVISTLCVAGRTDENTITHLNNILIEQTVLFSKGTVVDTSVVFTLINALGDIADPSSFDALFSVVMTKMDVPLISAAEKALQSIPETAYAGYIDLMLKNGTPEQKRVALHIALRNPSIRDNQKGKIAETALEAALTLSVPSENNTNIIDKSAQADIASIKIEAIQEITRLSWTKASPLVIRYFYTAQTEFKNRTLDVASLVEVIKCLGVMGTTEAAQTLSIYLGLLNSETEQTGMYNEHIMLAVINSLGILGDKAAFDYLLYVSYLNYPETVVTAARDSLARLKW